MLSNNRVMDEEKRFVFITFANLRNQKMPLDSKKVLEAEKTHI